MTEYKLKDLTIRTVDMQDLHEVARMWNFDQGPITLDEAANAINWMKHNHEQNQLHKIVHACFAIFDNASNTIIGWCGLDGRHSQNNPDGRIHIFYLIDKKYRCCSYGTECAKKMVEFGFTVMKVDRIDGGCALDNLASKKILEKIGMIRTDENDEEGYHFYITQENYLI